MALEDSQGALVTISLFEDQATLAAAQPLADRWHREHHAALDPHVTEVASGDVVAQKGL